MPTGSNQEKQHDTLEREVRAAAVDDDGERIMKTYQVLALIAAALITGGIFEIVSNDNFAAQRQQSNSAPPTAAAASAAAADRSPGR